MYVIFRRFWDYYRYARTSRGLPIGRACWWAWTWTQIWRRSRIIGLSRRPWQAGEVLPGSRPVKSQITLQRWQGESPRSLARRNWKRQRPDEQPRPSSDTLPPPIVAQSILLAELKD